MSKINSFKNRAQEATNHLFHRAWLISEVLQLVPFEVLFPFLFDFIFFQQVSKTQRPTHMCPATGWGWRWLLQLTLFGRGWATALFGKLSQILEIRFQKPVEMFPKAPWLQWEVVLLCHLNLGLKREGKGRKPKPKTNPKTSKELPCKLKLNELQFRSSTPTEEESDWEATCPQPPSLYVSRSNIPAVVRLSQWKDFFFKHYF